MRIELMTFRSTDLATCRNGRGGDEDMPSKFVYLSVIDFTRMRIELMTFRTGGLRSTDLATCRNDRGEK